MSIAHIALVFLVAFSHRCDASFEHGFEEDSAVTKRALEFPVVHEEHHHEPFVAAAVPVVHAAPPVVAAAPMVAPAPAIPFEVHEHHHHPPAAVHNTVQSFHSEHGHMSDTDMLLPFKRRRLAAKAARLRKNLHKTKHHHKRH